MAKAQVIISAKNDLGPGLKGAKRELDQFSLYAEQLGNKLKQALSIASLAAAAVAGIKALTDAGKRCVQEFSEAEKVSKRLTAVWENVGQATGKSAKQVDDYAEAIEKVTYFTSESIKEAGLLLAATESLTEEGFDRAMQASLDLAAAMGEDVTSAASTLAKAMTAPDEAFRSLKSIGVAFTEDEKKQIQALIDANKQFEAQDIILGKIEERYKGVAQAIADTPSGKLDAIKDTLGDIRETLGQGIVDALDPAFSFILEMLQKIHKWAKDHIDTASFWKTAAAGNSHTLYTDYSQEFIQARQIDAMSDLAEQLEIMRGTSWGKLIENSIGVSIEEALFMQADVLADYLDSYARFEYGDNYEDFIGTAEGFMEIVTEQYKPLVNMLETIEGALDEYNSFGLTKPEGGTSTTTTSAAVKSGLEEFFENYLPKDTVAEYQAVLMQAQEYLHKVQLIPSEEQYKLLGLSADATGSEYFAARAQAIENIEKIISSFTAKLDALTAVADSPVLTDIDQVLASYGKQSANYQLKVLKDEYNRIAEVFEYASDEEKVYLREILANNEAQRKALEDGIKGVSGGSFLDSLTDGLATSIAGLKARITGAAAWEVSDQDKAAASSLMSYAIESFGEAGEVVSELAANMATMGPLLGAIVTALKYVLQGLAEVIGPTLTESVNGAIEPLREFGRMIGQVIMPFLRDLMPLVNQSAQMFIKIFQFLGRVLEPIASFLSAMVLPEIQKLSAILEMLEPILTAIGDAMMFVSGIFSYVGQAIRHIIAVVWNWVASWVPWMDSIEDVGSPGNFLSYMAGYMADFHTGTDNTGAGSASTDIALASASYRGATSVTINIYAEGPIVGEGGMREFARMIRDEFDALNYYGVTT